ncbi:MAG: fumarylacetoacetate hydrolase family protein [Phototrophicaceae bacterium]
MKLARFAYNGKIHEAEYRDEQLWVGSVAYDPNDVMWLPPTETRGITIYGVALGYADHAEELGLDLPDYPIMFTKNPHSLIGHKATVTRPDVEYMHYEAELVAVIGRPCKNVKAADALNYVKGYTVGNDVTVRDFVGNYYRPPVKAKGFDGFGPVGPYLVSPDSIDPTNVSVKTYVNDELRQDGHTSHLRHSVADLIEYLTEFTTLYAGDMIWSGTPEGISHVYAGDVMRCEVEGIGALENPVN